MLKFADLSVDFKSYDNSLNSYMKLFPGSYTPLLIMYLAHKGLLKFAYEFEENDPRILVSVDGKSLHDFFGDGIMQELIPDPDVWKQKNLTFEEAFNLMNNSILKDRDIDVMLPLVHLWPFIVAEKPIALIADVSKDDQISDLIDLIDSTEHSSENSAALLFFSAMLMKKYEPLSDINEDVDDEDKSPMERICDKIASILSSIADWMRKANEKIKVFAVWLDEDHRRLISFLWANGLKIFKKVRPKKFSLTGRGGTGDPFWTGRITGWTSILIGMLGLPGVRFEPDFEEKVLDLDVQAKGHFFVLPVALIALRIYRNKDFRRFILKKKK